MTGYGPIQHGPKDILGYRKNGQPIYTIAGGAAGDPSVPADNGITVAGYTPAWSLPNAGSDHASPVSAAQEPESKLVRVGARTTGGAQVANATDQSWGAQFVTTGYDLVLDNVYRDSLIWDQFATKRPTSLTHNGAVVSFSATDDIDDDPDTALLIEDYDVLPSKFKGAHVEIGMQELGRVITRTNLTRGLSMIPFDPIAAMKIARNAQSTIDRLALKRLTASGGISFAPSTFGAAGGAVATVATASTPTNTLLDIAQNFETKNVEPFANGLYLGVLTPADYTALRKEANAAGWRYWQINQEESGGTGSIARREIGVYEGFMFMVNNRVSAATSGKSLFLGQDALAKVYPNVPGYGPAPMIEVAPVIDKLRRFMTIGWLWTGGYGRYKAEAVVASALA